MTVSHRTLRLRDCAGYPLALLGRSFAGRQIFDERVAEASARFDVRVEANSFEFLRTYVAQTTAITLQIEIGVVGNMPESRLVARPIDDRDLAHGHLVLGQLRGRNMPVAVAKFADQLSRRLHELRTMPTAEAVHW